MATPLHKLVPPIYRVPYTLPQIVITKKCGNPKCNETISTHDGFEYIHSHLEDKFFCDMYCMAESENETFDIMDQAARTQFLTDMEAEYRP